MTHPSVEPHLLVIFGATGDLTSRKLLPALAHLEDEGNLGARHQVVGVSRTSTESDGRYIPFALGGGEPEDYRRLAERLAEIETERDLPGNRVFYLALPPSAFGPTIEGLGEAGLNQSKGWTRLVIEKPVGRDLTSAVALNAIAHRYFDESQIYRIDHYLGKETVQNLLVFRFANAMFESMWNRDRIESVEITVAESLGVEDRAGYYERAGALRDMVQNHVTQLLTLVAMEVPGTFDAAAVRYEKIKVLRAVSPIQPEDVVFGRYGPGQIEGRDVPAYRKEAGVDAASETETYAALRLGIDNWRWKGVPFYVRTGKRLARRLSQVVVTFRRAPVCLFASAGGCEPRPNVLTLTLQPDEGFSLCIDVKTPGPEFSLRPVPLRFGYEDAFGALPDAYQTLLHDVLEGDQTLFVHAEEAEAAWHLYQPLLAGGQPVFPYTAGAWGPIEADALLAERGHAWRAQ